MSRIVVSRFPGSCALCEGSWQPGAPVSPFGESSAHAGAWGHPACVVADVSPIPSVMAARERVAAIRRDSTTGDTSTRGGD